MNGTHINHMIREKKTHKDKIQSIIQLRQVSMFFSCLKPIKNF